MTTDVQEQLRILRGQGALNRWEMRLQHLQEEVDSFAAWLEYDEDKEGQGLEGAKEHVQAALSSLQKALAVAEAKVEALQEFALKKRKKK